jgi:hypothetical protein
VELKLDLSSTSSRTLPNELVAAAEMSGEGAAKVGTLTLLSYYNEVCSVYLTSPKLNNLEVDRDS